MASRGFASVERRAGCEASCRKAALLLSSSKLCVLALRSEAGWEDGAGCARAMRGEDVVQVRLIVRGRVQGVWFRGATCDEARARGIVGWVKNRPDGAVEVLLQGERTAVEEVVAWAHTGPPGARVASVRRAEEPPDSEL